MRTSETGRIKSPTKIKLGQSDAIGNNVSIIKIANIAVKPALKPSAGVRSWLLFTRPIIKNRAIEIAVANAARAPMTVSDFMLASKMIAMPAAIPNAATHVRIASFSPITRPKIAAKIGAVAIMANVSATVV